MCEAIYIYIYIYIHTHTYTHIFMYSEFGVIHIKFLGDT